MYYNAVDDGTMIELWLGRYNLPHIQKIYKHLFYYKKANPNTDLHYLFRQAYPNSQTSLSITRSPGQMLVTLVASAMPPPEYFGISSDELPESDGTPCPGAHPDEWGWTYYLGHIGKGAKLAKDIGHNIQSDKLNTSCIITDVHDHAPMKDQSKRYNIRIGIVYSNVHIVGGKLVRPSNIGASIITEIL